MSNRSRSRNRRGAALLAVLWLSAALSAIAFSLATTVRGETDRASTLADTIRGRQIASGAIEWAILSLVYGPEAATFPPRLQYSFPNGHAIVEVIPETARLSLNQGRVEDFQRLLAALGADPSQAQQIAAGIVDWRTPGGSAGFVNSGLGQSFRPRHASFEEVEEALLVPGMTPALFHGNYAHDGQGRLVRLGAFKDCVSVYGTAGPFDVNGAEPALLAAIGVPPQSVGGIVQARRQHPFQNAGEVARLAGPGMARLMVGGNTIYTLRATAQVMRPDGQASDVRTTVSAQVKFFRQGGTRPYQILRWNQNATSEVALWQ